MLGDMRAFDAFVTQYQEYKSKAQEQRRTAVSLAHCVADSLRDLASVFTALSQRQALMSPDSAVARSYTAGSTTTHSSTCSVNSVREHNSTGPVVTQSNHRSTISTLQHSSAVRRRPTARVHRPSCQSIQRHPAPSANQFQIKLHASANPRGFLEGNFQARLRQTQPGLRPLLHLG